MIIHSCVSCKFKAHFFAKMTPEELEAVNKNRIEARYKKGDLICKQGTIPTHLICMYNGVSKVYIEGSSNILLQVLTSQNYIGLQSVFANETGREPLYRYSVAALDDSAACLIDLVPFKKVVQNNLIICREVLQYLSNMESDFLKKIETLSQKNSHGRIADTLMYLANTFNSDKIDLKLTRKDIAEFSATSLENTIRILSELKTDKIINLDGRSLEIIDKKKLEKIRELG